MRRAACSRPHSLNVLVVTAVTADVGEAPAPPRPDALIAAVVVRIAPGKHEEPVVEPVMPEGKSVMSHADTCEGAADSGAAEPRTHASKTTRAHADVTHPTTHPTTPSPTVATATVASTTMTPTTVTPTTVTPTSGRHI